MRIPQYWAKATAAEPDERGKPRSFSCWRSSDTSQQDAHESALAAATRILRSYLSGKKLDRYGYGEAPLREEVVQRFTDPTGETTAAVTRNGYGALVLSTERVMFVDVDFPPVAPGAELRRLVGSLFGRKQPSPTPGPEAAARDRIKAFVRGNPEWSARVYRTHSGLRLLATHALFDPAAQTTTADFEALGADPLYTRLCKAQGSFRARLTPKPWRCGQRQSPVAWPRETTDEQARFESWQADYTKLQANFATCRFLETLGDGAIHPDTHTAVEVHDHVTRCAEQLELA
jgi:hypothetical protein